MTQPSRWVQAGLWVVVAVLCGLRFWHLTADFPNFTVWGSDQAKFTDEGWWASAAIEHHLTGHWTVPGDYNPGVALPVWPLLLVALFHWTGVSLVAARALNVGLSVGTVVAAWWVVRRTVDERASWLAALLLVASPFAFVFSRLATLDTLVVFQFCLLVLVVTYIGKRRFSALVLLTLLTTAMVLTKTTAMIFLPGVFCMAWMSRKAGLTSALELVCALAVLPGLLFATYKGLIVHAGFGVDYRYFYEANGMPDVDWSQSYSTLLTLARNCFWVDRFLYPLAIAVLAVSIIWLRDLWRKPLFAGSWVVIATQLAFIFRRQDDFAPRYWLVFLLPMIFCVVLTVNALRLRSRACYLGAVFVIAGVTFANCMTIFDYTRHPTYQFYEAALSIRKVVLTDRAAKPLMLGVSAAEFSLATGIPSINDVFGSQELGARVLRYAPGWFLVWNRIGAENRDTLPGFRLERVASYPMFDDGDRNELILYRMER